MKQLYDIEGITKQSHHQTLRQIANESAKEPIYIGMICEIRKMHPGMGLRTMYEQFHPPGIGRDAFIELGLTYGYRLKTQKNPRITTRAVKSHLYVNLLSQKWFTSVNQLWVSDIFYFSLQDKHYYGVLIMDVYSRRIVGWAIADNMRAENNLKALQRALRLRNVPHFKEQLIHHSDRGGQYICDEYTNLLCNRGICISMCTHVLENAHIERVNGTIKNDYLNRWDIKSEAQLFRRMEMAVNNYNNRKHDSLGMTPIQFETYVNELNVEDRPKMQVFTYTQFVDNPGQLKLNFDLNGEL